MSTLRQQRVSSIRTITKASLAAFVLALLLSLVLLPGCPAVNAESEGTAEQAGQTTPVDDGSENGFVIEDTAVVDVIIEDEGE